LIIYIYRWKVKLGKETQFEDNWAIVTKAIRNQCGSYGSRLHFSENNEYIGYAQWPDIEMREKCALGDPLALEAKKQMQEAVERFYPDQILKIKSDFLIHP
jgi:hypothetical protein